MKNSLRFALLLVMASSAGLAHVGSPDVFFEGDAGPYHVFVTVRPPVVIPGVADIEVRSASSDLRTLRITPMPLTGAGARFAPTPDLAKPSKDDPQFFTGTLWMMTAGAWQVRLQAEGSKGSGELSVPAPALPLRTQSLQWTLGAALFLLMLILAIGVVSIVGAGVRDAPLKPGEKPSAAVEHRSKIVMGVTAALVVVILYLGNAWWNLEAGWVRRYLYRPLEISAGADSAGRLLLRLRDPAPPRFARRLDALLPDHGHLMHMFVIRTPDMDRFWHLHPEQVEPGVFTQDLPAIPAGRYQIFADVVLGIGLPETATVEIDLPAISGKPLAGDDSGGEAPRAGWAGTVFALPSGGRMIWERDGAPLRARKPSAFRFRVEDQNSRPAEGLELYMGMPGHAAFVRTDGSVFAHMHPNGSVPMAALALASPHAAHTAHFSALPPVISFPYGFPQGGDYRIFVQIKRAGRVETGVFDARVEQ